ncbi:uncharacterized protein LOC116197685 [Punica granatum]|uniref:Uncharacterized protein LOC116197685 n=1 Tax=Punica granatum TaxID=22663 RepID=A0A6P8CK97_PUNGR|nr:uncharacterized protein LOC116197685 [Punica granatum]
MAFDNNSSAPAELRPINVARTLVEDPRIVPAPAATTTGRPAGEGFYTNSPHETGNSPHSMPVYYPTPGIPDAAGFGGLGLGNAVPATWYPPRGAVGPAGHMSVNPALGLGYSPHLLTGISGTALDQVGNSDVATNFSVCPNLGTRIVGNLANQAGGESAGSFVGVSPHYVPRVGVGGVDQAVGANVGGTGFSGNSATRVSGSGPENVGGDSGSETGIRSDSFKRGSGSGADRASEDGGEDSVSGKKVKFLCSFGGKILPRPSDGVLRYVGGQTRIISVRKDVSFNELMQKMVETYGQPVVIKYQLPDEDLDALVSVSCPDDLDNMMDEYEKLVERSSDGSAKLRVFLFSASELDTSGLSQYRDLHDSGQRYMEAVNGIMDGIGVGFTRKESIASATSTQNSDISGSNEVVDSSILGQGEFTRPPSTNNVSLSPKEAPSVSKDASTMFFVEPNPSSYSDSSAVSNFRIPAVQSSAPQFQSPHGEVEPEKPVPLSGPQAVPYGMQAYMDPTKESIPRAVVMPPPPLMGFPSSHFLGTTGPIYAPQQLPDGSGISNRHQYVSPVHMTLGPATSHASMRQPFIQQPLIHQPQQAQFEQDGSSSGHRIVLLPVDSTHSTYHHQVAVPPTVGGGAYGWHPVFPPGQVAVSDGSSPNSQPEKLQIFEDCYMCQKALPHAHSDTLIQEQRDNRTGSGAGPSPTVYHSLPVEDNIRSRLASKPVVSEGSGEGITELASGIQSPAHMEVPHQGCMFVGSTPQPCLDNGLPQHVVNKPMNVETNPVGITSVEGSEQQFQGLPAEYSKLLDARIENLQMSAPEMLHSNDRSNQSLINDLWMAESLKPTQNQQQHNPLQEMLLNASEVPYLPEFQTGVSNQTSQPSELGIPRSHSQSKMGIQLDSQGVYNGNPALTSERIPSSAAWMDVKSLFQHMHVPSDAQAVPLHGNRQSFAPPLSRTEDQDSSLFVNQDPFNMHSDAHFPPPKPVKIALRKDALGNRDPFVDNSSGKVGEFDRDTLHSANNLNVEQVQTSREERIKQDLQDVAEGVVASVLQSASSSELGLSVSDGKQGAFEKMPEEEVREVDVESQSEALSEDTEAKLSEKVNLGFPVSEGLGRLQIIKNSDLEELRELGSGTYGTVYHGKWRGTDVAIKRINDRCFTGKPSEQERMRYDFWNEAIKLADLHHPNVVAFYGVVLDGPGGSIATVTEYMVNGSLRNALQKSERNLDKRKRLVIAMDVAFGMEYLHGKNIVHFDLKSDNLLVNLRDPHRPICKVGDLGLSKVKCQTLISGGVRGTLPWMAPELLNGSSSLVSEKVDVFSFGIVMWELLTGEEPYADLHYGAIIGGIVSNTLRPPVPESCDLDWRSLMERCWSAEPSERPTFTEIANELRSMSAKIPSKPQNHQ